MPAREAGNPRSMWTPTASPTGIISLRGACGPRVFGLRLGTELRLAAARGETYLFARTTEVVGCLMAKRELRRGVT